VAKDFFTKPSFYNGGFNFLDIYNIRKKKLDENYYEKGYYLFKK